MSPDTMTRPDQTSRRPLLIILFIVPLAFFIISLFAMTEKHNAQLWKMTEEHNAQLAEMTARHNLQLWKMTEEHNAQLTAQAAEFQKGR